jgi:Flp pilus assembly protein TadB
MATSDLELEQLLDEDALPNQRPPAPVPWGWCAFLVVLAGFDLVCLIWGRVPWSGGLDRADALLGIVVGFAFGFVLSLLAEAVAASHATEIGLSAQEMELVADELSVLTRPHRPGRATVLPLVALAFILCWLLAWRAFPEAWLPASVVFVALHALAGLATPVLWRNYRRANADFQVWLDARNAAIDAEAARRTQARRKRIAELTERVREAEDEIRRRLDAVPRVPPPPYLQPLAMWALPAVAIVLDIVLLCAPGFREAALGAAGAWWQQLWRMLVLWVQGCVAIGVIWALLSWYYLAVSDQVGRLWAGRDWSNGFAAIAIELLMALFAALVLIGLLGGWAPRFVIWNLLAPAPLLVGVLRDIRDTAQEHYDRNVRDRAEAGGAAPDEEAQEEG